MNERTPRHDEIDIGPAIFIHDASPPGPSDEGWSATDCQEGPNWTINAARQNPFSPSE